MLEDLLTKKKSAILSKWLQIVLDSYPLDSSRFMQQEKNRFANPVGYTISQELEKIYEELLHGVRYEEKVSPFLDRIMKVRAVQDFTPSGALAFIFLLKKVIREELGKEIKKNQLHEELFQFESRIDRLGMAAFDIFVQCKEKIFEIRVNDVKNRTYGLLKRTEMFYEIPNGEETKVNDEIVDGTAWSPKNQSNNHNS